jgi:hypothetical protein
MPATAATITAIIKNRVHEDNSGARATEDVALLYKRIKEEPIKAKKLFQEKTFQTT